MKRDNSTERIVELFFIVFIIFSLVSGIIQRNTEAYYVSFLLSIPLACEYGKRFVRLHRIGKLYDYISWCFGKSNFITKNSNIPDFIDLETLNRPYHLSSTEWDIAEPIILAFLSEVSFLFFHDKLPINKSFSKWDEREYFMFLLCEFFGTNDGHRTLSGLELYTDNGIRLSYGEDPPDDYYFDRLTDLGVVYNKLFYAALSYCQRNEKISSQFSSLYFTHISLSEIAQRIDTGLMRTYYNASSLESTKLFRSY